MNKKYLELTKLIRSKQNDHEILKCLSNYHENDIAGALELLNKDEKSRLYSILDTETLAGVLEYFTMENVSFH